MVKRSIKRKVKEEVVGVKAEERDVVKGDLVADIEDIGNMPKNRRGR